MLENVSHDQRSRAQRNIHGIITSQIQVADFEFPSHLIQQYWGGTRSIRIPFRTLVFLTSQEYRSKLESQTNGARKLPYSAQPPNANNY